MSNYLIMLGIVLFLVFILVYKAEYISKGNSGFFDINNCRAMRGFWCLIVILVHIPTVYQNKIQDMIGSFAYIGVTFFFMFSAYGLSLSIQKKNNSLKKFWCNRLFRLLVPNWITAVIKVLVFLVLVGKKVSISGSIFPSGWLRWLLTCYIVFGISNYFIFTNKYKNLIVYIVILGISILVYIMKSTGNINSTTWCTEILGFVWGIFLFEKYDEIKKFFCLNWRIKVITSCLLALVLGVLYLYLKPVIFWGDYILKILLGLSIICFILVLNCKIKIGNSIIWFLGDISYEIYLVHSVAIYIISHIWPSINSGGFILLSILLSVVLGKVIHFICKKIYAYIIF